MNNPERGAITDMYRKMFETAWEMPPKKLLEAVFSKAALSRILTMDCDKHYTSFEDGLLLTVQPLAKTNLVVSFPNSGQEYVDVLANVLNVETRKQILRNLAEFDEIAGCSCSDTFIPRRTYASWLSVLCDILMMASAQVSTLGSSPEASLTRWSTFDSSRSTAPSHTTGLSLKHPPSAINFGAPPDEVPLDKRVVQVHLEGPSLVEAWKCNNDVFGTQIGKVTLSKLDRDSLDVNASPDVGAAPPVFHGTAKHLQSLSRHWPNAWLTDTLNIKGNDAGTQTNPRGVPSVYTSFSAMRAFLWAAFRGTFYKNIPTTETVTLLSRTWSVGSKVFRGVAVFVFDSMVPAPSGCTAFVLPARKAEAFVQKVPEISNVLCASMDGKWTPNRAWAALQNIHGDSSGVWPDVLHSRETGAQLHDLQGLPMRMNLWRSCWTGKGIDRLNSPYKYTMAITFTYKPDPPAPTVDPTERPPEPPTNDDDGDDNNRKGKDKDKDKESGFGRMKKKLSKMSLRDSSGGGIKSGASGA